MIGFVVWAYNYITAFTQVCRKSRLKGGLACKLMLLFCVGIVHTNLYNCISEFLAIILYLELFDIASHVCG